MGEGIHIFFNNGTCVSSVGAASTCLFTSYSPLVAVRRLGTAHLQDV